MRARMLALVVMLGCPLLATGEGFLGGHAHKTSPTVDHEAMSRELQEAMSQVLGCSSSPQDHGAARLADVERAILPIWRALPRTAHERVDWRWVRYAAHRYFMKQSSVMIRGMEPARQVNDSHAGEAEILRHQVPDLVDMVVKGHKSSSGFSLQDVVALVAMLEQVVFNSETHLLERVYSDTDMSSEQRLEEGKLREVLEAYMIRWIMGNDEQGIQQMLLDEQARDETIPHWKDISKMVEGTVKSIDYRRQRAPGRGFGSPLAQGYSYQEAHQAVGSIGKSFASFWETTCQDIKISLVELDKERTGRVRLSDFYGANSDGEWRFGESEAYLRQLGALDESSSWRGTQVIIPNYLQAASNCIVSRDHYLVCCANECEDILNEVEAEVGLPLADPADILDIVGNMTDFNEDKPVLTKELVDQLQKVASSSGGKVALHGRLFAQWLHFVFPRDCPFPHKAGTITAITPLEFGDDYLVSEQDVDKHVKDGHMRAALTDARGETLEGNAEPWMSQWSEEEELIGDYADLQAPWEDGRSSRLAFGGAVALAVGLLLTVLQVASPASADAKNGAVLGTTAEARTHFV